MAKDRSLVIAVIGIVVIALTFTGIISNDQDTANGNDVGAGASSLQWIITCGKMYMPVLKKHCNTFGTKPTGIAWNEAACSATEDSLIECYMMA
jgi:hypothetical protein